MRNTRRNSKDGWTLVEMMIVITIAGILSTTVVVKFGSSFRRTRDNVRKMELRKLQGALATYYARNGNYPSTSNVWYTSEPGNNAAYQYNNGDYIPGLAPTYISKLPRDPLGGPGNIALSPSCSANLRSYYYRSDGTNFKLTSGCSEENIPLLSTDPFYDPFRPTLAWMVCSGEPACSTW